MRNMSFRLTAKQVRNQSKTVTRRLGWSFLKSGVLVQPVFKGMGLKKGESIEKIGVPILIVSTGKEPLNAITKSDCIKEGFPNFEPMDFVMMFQDHYKCEPDIFVNRIEFEYVNNQ